MSLHPGKRGAIWLAAVGGAMVCLIAQAQSADPALAEARRHAGAAKSMMQAFNDDVILPRKTPPQTQEARDFREGARREAEAAVRRFEAVTANKVKLSAEDLALSGQCRLMVLDHDRPSTQSDTDQRSQLEAALTDFSAGWTQAPSNAGALAGMIDVDRMLPDRAAGEAVIKKAGADPAVKLAAGRFYLEFGDAGQALKFLQPAGPDAEGHLYLAAALYMNGDAAGARSEAQAALVAQPGKEPAALFIEHLDALGGKSARGSESLVAAGAAFKQRGDHNVAIFFYEAAVKTAADGRTLYMLGDALASAAKVAHDAERAKRAAGLIDQAMAKGGMPDVTKYAALVPLAAAYETAGQTDQAIATYREIVAHDPSFYRYYFDLARCLRAQGKTAEADEAEAKGKALAPKTTFTVGAWQEEAEAKIGAADCGGAAALAPGEAKIAGRLTASGQGLAFAEVSILLDDCKAMTAPAETDGEGRFTASLPPGAHVFNGVRVNHYPRGGELTLKDLVYAPGKLDALYDSANTRGKPGGFTAAAGDNPALAFEAAFVKKLTISAPAAGASLPVAAAGETKVTWAAVDGAHHYLVSLYKVNGDILVPVKEKVPCPSPAVALGALFAAGLSAPAGGSYGVVVEAVDAGGKVMARSEGLHNFVLQ